MRLAYTAEGPTFGEAQIDLESKRQRLAIDLTLKPVMYRIWRCQNGNL